MRQTTLSILKYVSKRPIISLYTLQISVLNFEWIIFGMKIPLSYT